MPHFPGAEERRWLILALVVTTAVAVVDAAIGPRAVLIGALVAGPMLASFGSSPRWTALVALYAGALAVVLGVPNEIFGERDHLSRVGIVSGVGALAVWLATARARFRESHERYRLLARTGEILQRERDHEVALIRVARDVIVPHMADSAVVVFRREDGTLQQVAMAPWDPSKRVIAANIEPVIRSGRSELRDSDMVVPLEARGQTFGAIAFESRRRFDEGALELAEEVADRCALAIDSALLFRRLEAAESAVQDSRDQLRAILGGVAEGVVAQDPAGRVVYANEAARGVLGYESAESLLAATPEETARKFEIFDEHGEPFPAERLPGRLAIAERRRQEVVLRMRTKATGVERWISVKAAPLLDHDGRASLVISVFEDVTDAMERERHQRFLAETGALLSRSLDYEETLTAVAQLAVPQIADWCVVDMLEPDGTIEALAIAHMQPEKVILARELRREYPAQADNPQGVAAVVRSGEAQLISQIPASLLEESAEDARHLQLLRELGLGSAMIVPLTARGRTLGAITFVVGEWRRRFDEDDLTLALELASRCALAVDNARLFRERSYVARTLQESLLPPQLPAVPGLEIAARFRAAGAGYDVGGDFYDLFESAASNWCAVIGDVCGKGPEAAALTALARYTVRAAGMTESQPVRVLTRLNEAILREQPGRRFMTVAYVVMELRGDTVGLRVATAGHPAPLLLRADGSVEEVGVAGTLLGVVPELELTEATAELRPGDALVLYTDGLTDAAAPTRILEPDDLGAVLRPCVGANADRIARALELAAVEFVEAEPRDDIAILVARMEGKLVETAPWTRSASGAS